MMVLSERASNAAEELLEQARAERLPPRSPPRYVLSHYPELRMFEPAKMYSVLKQAQSRADRRWQVLLACAAWLACAFGFFVFMPDRFANASAIAVFLLGAPFLLVRRAFIRRELVAIAEAREIETPD
jgi:hypothetical protein